MFGLALTVAVTFAQLHCSLADAHYTLHGAADVSAAFHFARSPINQPPRAILIIRSNRLKTTYSFSPMEIGSGAGIKTHLVINGSDGPASNTRDYLQAIFQPMDIYLVANARYEFDQRFSPEPETEAPDHILIPGLQELMWYGNFNTREDVPVSFFDFSDCHANGAPDSTKTGP